MPKLTLVTSGAGAPVAAPQEPILINLPLHDVDRIPAILLSLAAAIDIATIIAIKRDHSDETVLDGIRRVFAAFATLTGL